MNSEDYKKLVKNHLPKEHRLRNFSISFLVGGFLGLIAEIINNVILSFGIAQNTSLMIICMLYIFLASLFTALGFFDKWIEKAKCGLIVPTTGFAHSICSSALEYKKEGMITGLGSNFFKLAGSVILYGIISSFFFCLLWVIIYG